MTAPREAWQRGPIAGVPPLLQPVAHALVQASEEVRAIAAPLDEAALWARPNGAASCGFHVLHAAGSLDRLFTYARGEQLTDTQRERLAEEQRAGPPTDASLLVARFEATVARALEQLQGTPESSLTEPREVGRARIPSTVIGLLFHAAEHTMRHVGQLVATAKVVTASLPRDEQPQAIDLPSDRDPLAAAPCDAQEHSRDDEKSSIHTT